MDLVSFGILKHSLFIEKRFVLETDACGHWSSDKG